jgi:hypothetical protein
LKICNHSTGFVLRFDFQYVKVSRKGVDSGVLWV